MEGTFHRRELRAPSVAFSSQEGKQIFRMAMLEGGLEGYFHLSESFQTQGHPAWCGLGSLTTALNSLLIDPGRTWQGVWRYFDESMLDCCLPLDVIRLTGITLSKLACLARCNGARPVLRYADAVTVEEFRADVMTVSLLQEEQGREGRAVMVASYSRKPLNQTGDGHFSPVGGYCAEKDMVLIMDVARFKYPPHWVPLPLLHQAMQRVDQESGLSRGYLLLSAERAWAGSRCVECDCRACSTNQLSDGAHTPGCCASLCSPTPAPLSPSSAHSSNEPLSPSLPSPPDVQTGCCALLDVADSLPHATGCSTTGTSAGASGSPSADACTGGAGTTAGVGAGAGVEVGVVAGAGVDSGLDPSSRLRCLLEHTCPFCANKA